MVDISSMLTVEEVAKEAKGNIQLIRKEIREGKLKAVKCGREYRVTREELNKYLGIEINEESLKRELYIKELEGKVKHLTFILNSVKGNLNNISLVLSDD